jgi:DNA polymerase-3 subunit delta
MHGENSYLVREAVAVLKQKFLAAEGDLNLATFEGGSATEDEIMSACETLPFLGTQRLVIVLDWSWKKPAERLSEFVGRLPKHCQLVFAGDKADARVKLYKALKKHGEVTEYAALKPAEYTAWLRQLASTRGITLEPAAAELLGLYTLGDCSAGANELAKLATYAADEPITKAMVEKLVHPDLHTSIFRLTDAVSARETAAALASLADLEQRGEDLVQVFHMLVRQIRIYLGIQGFLAQGGSPSELASTLGLHPYVAQTSARQVRSWTEPELRAAHARLLDIDTALKTGRLTYTTNNTTEFSFVLEQFILAL